MDTPHARQEASDAGATRVWRTGPVSRLYRLGLAVLLGLSAYSLILGGPGGFSQPDTAQEPGVWILTGFALLAVRDAAATAFGPRWGGRALAAIVALLAVAGAAALAADGALWATPFTWLLYGLDLTFAIAIGAAMLVSIVVGTPGCELGGVRELVLRLQGRFDPRQVRAPACGGGLHQLDRWEARQLWRARP
jgi:hypothetical protein